jgi:hypothetical protein
MKSRPWTRPEKWGLIVAVVAILISLILPEIRRMLGLDKSAPEEFIAGIVIDENTHQAVGQATLTIDGRTEEYVTEDNGNFRIDFHGDVPNRVRLHVTRRGFQPLDTSVEPPAENLVLQLHKQ